MKKEHFLNELVNKKNKKDFINSIGENIDKISRERKAIAEKIEDLIEKKYSKKDILELMLQNTLLTKQNITSMIEEYYFAKNYSLPYTINYNEIKIIKQIFKQKNYTKEEEKDFLNQTNLKEILISENFKLLKDNKISFKHNITFDEDTEIIFNNLKEHFSIILNKKITNSELLYYSLIELYNSNPIELNNDINKEKINF